MSYATKELVDEHGNHVLHVDGTYGYQQVGLRHQWVGRVRWDGSEGILNSGRFCVRLAGGLAANVEFLNEGGSADFVRGSLVFNGSLFGDEPAQEVQG
jgi:hypothetical protein